MVTLTSKDNSNIKNAIKLKNSSRYRRQTGLFIAEGLRICFDAMLSSAVIETMFVTEKAIEKFSDKFDKLKDYSKKTYVVTDKIFELISDTENSQGILCIIKALDKISEFDTIKKNGKFLALDNLQDPNNLGTILRSAEAFGIDCIVMSNDCCDIYSPKVVRGSMGAIFRIPFIVCGSIESFLSENPDLNSYAAVVDDSALSVNEIKFNTPCIAVIGNEGNGLKQNTIDACDYKITIPMSGNAESLNASVAASIIIWEMIK